MAEEAYRCYVTDALRAYLGMNLRYYDAIHPAPDFDAEQVVEDVIARAGLEVR